MINQRVAIHVQTVRQDLFLVVHFDVATMGGVPMAVGVRQEMTVVHTYNLRLHVAVVTVSGEPVVPAKQPT